MEFFTFLCHSLHNHLIRLPSTTYGEVSARANFFFGRTFDLADIRSTGQRSTTDAFNPLLTAMVAIICTLTVYNADMRYAAHVLHACSCTRDREAPPQVSPTRTMILNILVFLMIGLTLLSR